MKLYIPTTTLNFNNILSTESVSPKSFYQSRGFGYSRWFTIPENDMDNVILLYESPINIVRPESEMEDHPLLIEIETDESFPVLQDGVHYSQHTIYLDPWHTKFIFFSEKDKITALSISDSSLETKLLRLYKNKLEVKDINNSTSIILKNSIEIPVDKNSIELDVKRNKVKGLLYGFYIGALLSATEEQINKLNTLRSILNIFAAVISSHDRKPSESQLYKLNELFLFMNKQEPIYQMLLKEIDDEKKTDNVVSILKNSGYNIFRNDWSKLIDYLKNDSGENNFAITWINREIEKTIQDINHNKQPLSTDKEQLITVDLKVSTVSSEIIPDIDENRLYIYWVNNLLISNKYDGKVSSRKSELSDDLTQLAKDSLGNKWMESPIRTYLNQLRRHVRGDEFNQAWNNGILSSVASVILKGDEWDTLLRFMQEKGMTDYRLAFSVYGVLNGFANLTRDFSDILLNIKDRKYLAEFYREVAGQLYGMSIDANVTSIIESDLPDVKSDKIDAPDLPEFANNTEKWKNSIRYYLQKMNISKKKYAELKSDLEQAFNEFGEEIDYVNFFAYLNDFESWKTSSGKPNKYWNELCNHFCPEEYKARFGKKKNKQKNENGQLSLFDKKSNNYHTTSDRASDSNDKQTSHNLILEDNSWINHCATFIRDEKSRIFFIKEMNWFVQNHKQSYIDEKGVSSQGRYYGEDKSNYKTCERLKGYMEKKLRYKEENKQWIAKLYEQIPIEDIIKYLRNKYGI